MLPAPTMPARNALRHRQFPLASISSTVRATLVDARRPGLVASSRASARRAAARTGLVERRSIAATNSSRVAATRRSVSAIARDLGHRRRHDRQPGRQVLAQLERIDERHALVDAIRDHADVEALAISGQLVVRASGRAGGRSAGPAIADTSVELLADQHDRPRRAARARRARSARSRPSRAACRRSRCAGAAARRGRPAPTVAASSARANSA